MTTLSWDNQQINHQFAQCETLKDIIVQIEDEFSLKGEVICEIHVNGVRLDESDESRYANSLKESIQDLMIFTSRADTLINEALNSANEFIPELEGACVRAAEALRGLGDSQTSGQRLFGETLEGCQWLIDTLGHIRGAAIGIGLPVERTERWLEAERLISKVVRDISAAYQSHDHVLVADLLEYELTAALQLWQQALLNESTRRAA